MRKVVQVLIHVQRCHIFVWVVRKGIQAEILLCVLGWVWDKKRLQNNTMFWSLFCSLKLSCITADSGIKHEFHSWPAVVVRLLEFLDVHTPLASCKFDQFELPIKYLSNLCVWSFESFSIPETDCLPPGYFDQAYKWKSRFLPLGNNVAQYDLLEAL